MRVHTTIIKQKLTIRCTIKSGQQQHLKVTFVTISSKQKKNLASCTLESVYLGMLPGPPVAAAPCRNCSLDHTCLMLFSLFSAVASAAHLGKEGEVRGDTHAIMFYCTGGLMDPTVAVVFWSGYLQCDLCFNGNSDRIVRDCGAFKSLTSLGIDSVWF